MSTVSDAFALPASGQRTMWVFGLDLPEDQIEAFQKQTYDRDGTLTDWPLGQALGLTDLNPEYIEITELAPLSDYTFARYLSEANGMDPAQITPEAAMLNALTGHAVIVFSEALRGQPLRPDNTLSFVGRYSEPMVIPPMDKLTSNSSAGDVTPVKKPKSDAAIGGMIATYVLIFLFVLVGVMIWIA